MPVDLFSAYIDGREKAIDRNWNDLNQSNTVEQGWLHNDAQQLKNWMATDTYGDDVSNSNAGAEIKRNSAIGSDLNTQLAQTGQPGALAATQSLSDYQAAVAAASKPNIQTLAYNQAAYQVGQSADDAARGRALSQGSTQLRSQQLRNENAVAQNNAAGLQSARDLLPLQTQVTNAGLEAQRRALAAYPGPPQGDTPGQGQPQGAPPLFPPMVPMPLSAADAYNAASILGPGQSTVVNGVTVARDEIGLYTMANGVKSYIQAPQPPVRPPNTPFNFGKK